MGGNFDLATELQAINQQLELVSLREKRGRIFVRGRNFPPRPGELHNNREEFSLGVGITPAGIRAAAARAKEIDSQLLWGKFDWQPWLKGSRKIPETIAQWIEKYEKNHWQCTPKDLTKENSYHKNYRLYFQKLPQDEPLTIDILRNTITQRSKPATRNREFYCMAYRRLAEFAAKHGVISAEDLAEFKIEIRALEKGYEPEAILPENVPSDAEIMRIYDSIRNPGWQWVYGMLAAYGIRPSEIWNLDLDRYTQETEALRVRNTTKTGVRLTYPCPSAWREDFELWEICYPETETEGVSNNKLGEKITWGFRQLNIPHSPKMLRHAWCIRTIMLGIPDSVAAKWAGHSVAVHTKTYHQAISQIQHQKVFDQMKQRESNRPSFAPEG